MDASLRRYKDYVNACRDPMRPVLSYSTFAILYPVVTIDINPNTAATSSPDEVADSIGPRVPYSADGLVLQVQIADPTNDAVGPGDVLGPLDLWCIAEPPAGVLFSGDGTEGAVAGRKIGC